MRQLAPIVIFAYNRIDCLKQTIGHLKKNELASDSDLIIYSDGPRKEEDIEKVSKVRGFLHSIEGFKSVTIKESPENKGLANSVISGVTEVLKKYKRAIVVEDDIITSTDFLDFMNEALDFYAEDEKIWSVTGYCPPIKIPKDYPHDIYLTLRPSSWGWGTWLDRWEKVDWEVKDFSRLLKSRKMRKAFNKGGNDLFGMLKRQMNGEIDSWAIRWSYNQFKFKTYSVYPKNTKIEHVGFGEEATHVKKEQGVQNKLDNQIHSYCLVEVKSNKQILQSLKKINQTVLMTWIKKLYFYCKRR